MDNFGKVFSQPSNCFAGNSGSASSISGSAGTTGAQAQAYAIHCGMGRNAHGVVGVAAMLKSGVLPHIILSQSEAASEALVRVAEGLTQQRHALQAFLEGPPIAVLTDLRCTPTSRNFEFFQPKN